MSGLNRARELGWTKRFRQAEMGALLVLWVTVAVLQTKRIRLGVVTSYGADVCMPAWLYVCTREGKTVLKNLGLPVERPVVVAGIIFALSVGWEIGQKLRWIPGVFDWFDIAAYGIGIGAVLLMDLWLMRREMK